VYYIEKDYLPTDVAFTTCKIKIAAKNKIVFILFLFAIVDVLLSSVCCYQMMSVLQQLNCCKEFDPTRELL